VLLLLEESLTTSKFFAFRFVPPKEEVFLWEVEKGGEAVEGNASSMKLTFPSFVFQVRNDFFVGPTVRRWYLRQAQLEGVERYESELRFLRFSSPQAFADRSFLSFQVQTGGPDGDLGSNEILLSNERTIAIIDGSGVIHDQAGLNRA